MNRPKIKRPGFIAETFRSLILLVVVFTLSDMAMPRSVVSGRSMQPTFIDGEMLLVSRVHYLLETPQRGEFVVFNSVNPAEEGVMIIKRVIGLPGETITLRDQIVHVNGQALDEPYLPEACGMRCRDQTVTLDEDEYFLMGDNRNHSNDSRAFGAVPADHLIGRVIFRYFPLDRLGFVSTHDYQLQSLDGRT